MPKGKILMGKGPKKADKKLRPLSGSEYGRYKDSVAASARAQGRVYGESTSFMGLKGPDPDKVLKVATGGKVKNMPTYRVGAARQTPVKSKRKGGK
jgi:hypothetical protein